MTFDDFVSNLVQPANFNSIGLLFVLIAGISAIEFAIPLYPRDRSRRPHALSNLLLTGLTLALGLVMGSAILVGLAWCEATGFGFLPSAGAGPIWAFAVGVLALDFATYLCHVAMHKVPAWWRYHRVHLSDFAVDVTTALRQHPGETVIRHAFLAVAGFALGAPPAAFAAYRLLSALTALPEHANIRVPPWVDDVLSLVVTWPTLHKVHHSRAAHETDTNYGNILSIWDRLFFTFTAARRGREVVYGLDGFDDTRDHTVAGLLAMPFRRSNDR